MSGQRSWPPDRSHRVMVYGLATAKHDTTANISYLEREKLELKCMLLFRECGKNSEISSFQMLVRATRQMANELTSL